MKDRLISTMVSCVLSLLILLAVLGATFPTKSAVSTQIKLESPYVGDRSLILYRLEQIEKKLDMLLQK